MVSIRHFHIFYINHTLVASSHVAERPISMENACFHGNVNMTRINHLVSERIVLSFIVITVKGNCRLEQIIPIVMKTVARIQYLPCKYLVTKQNLLLSNHFPTIGTPKAQNQLYCAPPINQIQT